MATNNSPVPIISQTIKAHMEQKPVVPVWQQQQKQK